MEPVTERRPALVAPGWSARSRSHTLQRAERMGSACGLPRHGQHQGRLGYGASRRSQPGAQPIDVRTQLVARSRWRRVYGSRQHHRQLSQNWRLDLLAGDLGQAQLEGQPQLITVHPTNGTSGIELREGDLSLNSDWRLEDGSRSLPAVGWSESADALVTHLNLPPGWELLGASGVDQVEHTWPANWDLLVCSSYWSSRLRPHGSPT